MTEETAAVPAEGEAPVENAEKPVRRRGGNRKPRKPKLKDWVRVINSQGNGLPNKNVHLILNEATGLVELVTNAAKQDGSEEMEGERTQVFKIDTFELINDPNRDPLAVEEEETTEAPAEGAAPESS